MLDHTTTSDRTLAIQRVTALWALNECGLGGILHAFNSPFTGLLVGSLAMVCIAFICSLSENKWRTVMTSLVIVLIIKALVSPHSSPTAYVAVIFQGVTGALIYRYIPHLLIGSLFFFSLGLIESALQRLIMLTVLYGNSLWEAIDIWGKWVMDKWGVILPLSSSKLIIYTYLGIHFIVGLLMGWLTFRIIHAVKASWGQPQFQLQLSAADRKEFRRKSGKGKSSWKRVVFLILILVMISLAYTQLMDTGNAIQKGFVTLLRVVLILIAWYLFLGPLFLRLIQSFLKRKHHQLAGEVAHTMDMFPQILWIIDKAWKETSSLRFIRRWKSFVLYSLIYLLQYKTAYDPDPDGADPKL